MLWILCKRLAMGFLLCYFSLLIIFNGHKTMVFFDQIVLYRLQRIKSISMICVSSFKIETETPIAGRYLMDETKLTRVEISQVRYKQHLIVGHCDIMVAEWIANSFKSQHGLSSKTVREITRLVQNNRKTWPASVISHQLSRVLVGLVELWT